MMKILKFGGSSVATPERIKGVIEIIAKAQQEKGKIAVVVSAMGGTTDALIKMGHQAISGKIDYTDLIKEVEKRHFDVIKAFIKVKRQSAALAMVKMTINELEDVLHGVFLVKELSPRTLDFIMSFGERLSAYVISECLKDSDVDAAFLDARKIIVTDDHFSMARVDFEASNKKIAAYFKSNKEVQVVTGFIGATENNETTTFGRSGSDYTASILGAALGVKSIEIWTDVNGMMTADPRKVKKSFPVSTMTYEEAMEMSHFGAKVIYPATMQPAMNKNIPIVIKNTFNPEFPGTLICKNNSKDLQVIKGISSIEDVCLLRLQGSGMMGIIGISMRLFTALARKRINVILITQASSEYSICFAVSSKDAIPAKKEIEKEFGIEIKTKLIEEIIVEQDLSIVAIVGGNMRHTPGMSGKMFHALGKNGVNVIAIAQGSSELNISAVIHKADESKALHALHEAFFLSDKKSLNIFIVGTGLVGNTLISMIQSHFAYLSTEQFIEPTIIGLANSKKMFFNPHGIDLKTWKKKLDQSESASSIEEFVKQMKKLNLPNSVFVDCTASEALAVHYNTILESSISIVTPNKKANSGSYSNYKKLKQASQKYGVKFLYETNVGAGLPVINTLNDLLYSGDKILKIEAVLSGTISYIFNTFTKDTSFSEIVQQAKEKGYTEPDPRDDLNGMDVARKLLILARETGLPFEMKDIKIGNIVSEKCMKANSVDNFFKELLKEDASLEQHRAAAEKKGMKLRYIAVLEKGKASISLQAVDANHPFYSLSGSDNIISFTTDRYKERPLVVKGPGAGAEVTAAGVFADIIRISNLSS
jgi:aspartokinase/homoserine dehydrogenase 1